MYKYLKVYLKLFIPTFLLSLPVGVLFGCYVLFMGVLFGMEFAGPESIEWVLVRLDKSVRAVGLLGCLLTPSMIFAGVMHGTWSWVVARGISETDTGKS